MKKCYYLSAAIITFAFAGCTEEPFSMEDGNEITIEAVMAENPASRTIIQEGTTSVLWEPGDEVKVFYNGVGSRFTSTNTESVGVAQFTGSLSSIIGFNEGFSDTTPLWGLYPYRADAMADNTSVTTTLPASQTGRAGSFAKGTNITLGKSSSLTMGFYNVCGGVRFSLTQEGVKEVVFEGQNNDYIAGKVKLAFVDGVPAVQEVLEGQKAITLTAPNGGTFETGKWYYIVALPGTLSGGFKMTFNTATQYATLKSSGTKTIKRGIFGTLADADEDLIYKDKGGDDPNPDDFIQFEDPIAKYACVEKFDTNRDGEVSYAEAAAATSMSGLFTDYNTVTSFDEIKFFTGVTSTSGVFTGCTKLTHITIPDWITTLGSFQNCSALETVVLPEALSTIPTYCFDGCSALKDVTLPNSITAIPNYSFRNCTALTTLTLPSTVLSVGTQAFYGCTQLFALDLPSGLNTIGGDAFMNCQSLASLDFPTSLTSIGWNAFKNCISLTSVILGNGVSLGVDVFFGCSKLTSVVLPDDLISIPSYCFGNCVALTTITWPRALTSIGDNAFANCPFVGNGYSLELPTTVNSIGSKAFSVRHLIVPSTSPVSIASDSFFNNWTLVYVPSTMVEMYKVRTNWSEYAHFIYSLSDYPVSPSDEVDLGLSVKWASFNLGATVPEEVGAFFSWGETYPKNEYTWLNYKFRISGDRYDNVTFSKYVLDSRYGIIDNKSVLEPEDDAAHIHLGGNWRMPTGEELQELIDNCTVEWTTLNGVYGRKVTSNKTGYTANWIFLPAAGSWTSNGYSLNGTEGRYWTSSLRNDYAYNLHFNSSYFYKDSYARYFGYAIRPVCD